MLDITKYESPEVMTLESFAYMHSLLGNINVIETSDQIVIEGIAGRDYANDIFRIWRSTKIAENLFTRVKSNALVFHKFFAPEILYTLKTIRDVRNRRPIVSKRTLETTIEKLTANSWLANIDQPHPDILNFDRLNNLTLPLLKHQMEFLTVYNYMVPRYVLNGYLLAAPPGSGKTINGLALAECLDADTVIVVAPNNSLYKVWKKTVSTGIEDYCISNEDLSDTFDYFEMVTLESLISNSIFKKPTKCWVSQDKLPFDQSCKHFVFHYEALDQALRLADERDCGKVVIILDECHNFNETSAQRTNMFVDLCRKTNCKHVLWASGTPIKAIGNEAIPLLKTIDPFFTATVEEAFRKIFGKSAKSGLDILQHRMGLVTYKISKDQIRKEKPIVIPVKVKLPADESYRYTLAAIKEDMSAYITTQLAYYTKNMREFEKEYSRCLAIHEKTLDSSDDRKAFARYKDYVRQIQAGYDPVALKQEAMYCNQYEELIADNLTPTDKKMFRDYKSIIKYVQLKVQGECLGRILGKRRAECNTALVQHAELEKIVELADKKTVIFSSWVDTIKEAEDYLLDKGFIPCMVYGGTNSEVTQIITRFEKDPDINPCIATYQSLSTAVPLIVANTVILLNQPFRDHEWDQAVARVDRIGQDTQVYVFEVLLDTGNEPNISTRSKDILEWSKAQIQAILGSDVPTDYEDLIKMSFMEINNPLVALADKSIRSLSDGFHSVVGKFSKYF